MGIVPKPIAPGTLALHGGQKPDPTTRSRATPIHQTVSYVFEDGEHASSLFSIARAGYVYSRISNPTVAVLEERMAALDCGVGAVAASSGMAAIHLTIATLLSAGDHIVSSRSLYGGTHNLLSYTMPRFGIDTTFVDPRSPRAFADAINERTKMVFAETLGNPLLEVLDLPAVAAIAHERGLPLVGRRHHDHAPAAEIAPVGGRSDSSFADEIRRRSRHRPGRLRRRQRFFRLGGFRALPDPERGFPRVQRARSRRGIWPQRLSRRRPHAGAARFRRLSEPAERLLPAAGARGPCRCAFAVTPKTPTPSWIF